MPRLLSPNHKGLHSLIVLVAAVAVMQLLVNASPVRAEAENPSGSSLSAVPEYEAASATRLLSNGEAAQLRSDASDPALQAWYAGFMRTLRGERRNRERTRWLTTMQEATLPSISEADGWWSELPPPTRWGHCAIYDPLRHRMILCGGYSGGAGGTWALSLGPVATWDKIPTVGSSSGGGFGGAAIYDPVRDRMVTFGGSLGNGVSALSLSGTPTWVQLHPTGTPPSGRIETTAIYDPLRDRMLICGGDDGEYLSDTWSLTLGDSPAWTRLEPAGDLPPGRIDATTIYDPIRDRLVLLGGETYSGEGAGVWALSLSGPLVWTQLSDLAWDREQAGAYDPVRDRIIVHGPGSDVRAFELGGVPHWVGINAGGEVPPPRWDHVAIYDPISDCLIIHGGLDRNASGFGDTYALSLSAKPTWSPVSPGGAAPIGRAGHTALYDPVRARMLVFGGEGSQIWACALAGPPLWSRVTTEGSPPESANGISVVYDAGRDRLLFIGGWSGEAWTLTLSDPPTWAQLPAQGVPPSARADESAIYDPVRQRVVIFGGEHEGTFMNDVWALSLLGTPEWCQLAPAGPLPSARAYHAAVYDPARDRMLVQGGGTASSSYHGTWALTLGTTPAWSQLLPDASAAPGSGAHDVIYDSVRDRLMVMPGGAALPLSGPLAWTHPTFTGNAPDGRIGESAIYDPVRDRAIVFGGLIDTSWSDFSGGILFIGDLWELAFDQVTAIALSNFSAEAGFDGVRLSWSLRADSRAELQVMRADSEAGPFTPVSGLLAQAPGTSVGSFHDTSVQPGRDYFYRVACREAGSWTYSTALRITTPAAAFGLLQIAPNPVGASGTRLVFGMARAGRARLELFDVRGALVRTLVNGRLGTGANALAWDGCGEDGRRLAGGMYFLKLSSGGAVSTRKVLVAR